MTPEEKFNQEIWWTLQAIKKEQLSTPTGKNVKINTTRLANKDSNSPPTDDISKCIRKLEELGAFIIIEKYNPDSYDPYEFDTDWDWATEFILTINQSKLGELYAKYKNSVALAEDRWLKPIVKKIEDRKLLYKKDGLFYSLWKYANAHRLAGKSLIAFMDLAPLEGNPRFAIFEFLNGLQELKIELENITFHEDIYKKYCKIEHDYITEYIARNPKADFSKAIKELFGNHATFDDVFKILGKFDELVKMKLQLNGLLEFIEFSSSPSIKNIESLNGHLETYINCFIEDKLFSSELKNFYKFSRHKEIFLEQIENEVRNYGLKFVFKQGEVISERMSFSIGKDEAYLFIHTLAALEKQDFFEIESILITDMDVPPEKQTDDYKIKVLATEKLLNEYKPKNIYPYERIQKPQIVGGKTEVDGLQDGLKSIAQSKKESGKPVFPYKLPAGTKWEEITIKFNNDFDVVVIIKGKEYESDYEKMGFADKRIKKANEKTKANGSWAFLLVLSIAKGVFPIDKLTGKQKEQRKKQKQSLSQSLVKLFPMIEDKDPFYEYNDIEKVYKIKIKLIPIQTFRDDFRDKDIKDESDDELGIKESFDKMTDNK